MAPTTRCSSTSTGRSSRGRSRTSGGARATRLLTPALELGILAGETRSALLELAPSLGYETEEGVYRLDRLLGAEEAFTSSSVREVMPVAAVDDRAYASREAAEALQRALRRAARALTVRRGVRKRPGRGT